MGIIRFEPCASIRADGSIPLPSSILIFMLLLFMGCATVPKIDRCSTQDDIRFVVLEGFEVVHDSCVDDLEAVSWKTEIEVCRDKIWTGTNLWCYWNGCGYKLVQQEGEEEDISIVGFFRTLDQIKEFIEITMPMVRKN